MATVIPANRAVFSVEEIARAADGKILRGGGVSQGVCTDSRAITSGVAFVALVGDKFDGHAFLQSAVELGARTLVVSRGQVDTPAAVVEVHDTRSALGALGRLHRVRWGASPHPRGARSVVAITGSAGKTTTKTVLARLLARVSGEGLHASAGNLNNDIGVPMTLFGLEDVHRYAVVELGTSARGEIENLAAIALPQIGVLTLVAAAHTRDIGSIDDVATEKGALLAALPGEGLAVVNADDQRALAQLSRSPARNRRTYGFSDRAAYRIRARTSRGLSGSLVTIERSAEVIAFETPLLGDAGALAVAASLAVVEWLVERAVSVEEIQEALADLVAGGEGRLSPLMLADGTWVLDDSYNANPASMQSSIVTAAELALQQHKRLVLILGEMRELGELSAGEHHAIGALAAGSAAACVIGVGGDAVHIAEQAQKSGKAARFAVDSEQAIEAAFDFVLPGDVVLVKGSRGVATDKIVRALIARGGAPGSRA